MKFAIWILVITAVLSLFSMLVVEFLPPGSGAASLIRFFGLQDPFRAWWFRLLLGILAVSLTICVIRNGPHQVRQAFSRKFIDNPQALKSFTGYRIYELPEGDNWISGHFECMGLSVQRREIHEGFALSGRSGAISRLGPLLNHTGMLLLIIGGLVAVVSGYHARISGSAGDTISRPEWNFDLRIDDFKLVYYPISLNQWIEAPDGYRGKVVDIRGDSARVELTSHAGLGSDRWLPKDSLKNDFTIHRNGRSMPYEGNIRSYITRAALIVDGQQLFQRNIEVNHPLRFRGYRFYQTSFESGYDNVKVDSVVVLVSSEEHGEATVSLAVQGGAEKLSWNNLRIQADEFYPDFRLDRNMQPFSASGRLDNPAVRINVFDGDDEIGGKWVFTHDFDGMGEADIPVSFRIIDLMGVRTTPTDFVTILDVKRESGRWIIWTGFIFVTLGLILIYTMNHRQAWAVVIRKPDGNDEVHLAFRSSRTDQRFQDYFDRLENVECLR